MKTKEQYVTDAKAFANWPLDRQLGVYDFTGFDEEAQAMLNDVRTAGDKLRKHFRSKFEMDK